MKCMTSTCRNQATQRIGTADYGFDVCDDCAGGQPAPRPPWFEDVAPTRKSLEYDHSTRIERRFVDGKLVDACGAKGIAYPKTRQDLVDLGVDPYIWDAFGGLEQFDPNKKRRAAPAPRDTSRAAAESRPTDEDEEWRRNQYGHAYHCEREATHRVSLNESQFSRCAASCG